MDGMLSQEEIKVSNAYFNDVVRCSLQIFLIILEFYESLSRFIVHPYSLISHYLVLVEGL